MNSPASVLRLFVCLLFFLLVAPAPASASFSSFFRSFSSVFSSHPQFGYVRPSVGVLSVFPGRLGSHSSPKDLSVFTSPVQEASLPFFSHRGLVLHGYVISADLASDEDADSGTCKPFALKHSRTEKLNGTELLFILLVASATTAEGSPSSNCSHFVQALHAQEAGYKAVIIYNVGSNETDDLDLESDSGSGSIHIPVYFVGEYDGLTIRDWYTLTYSRTYFVTIRIPSPLIATLVLYGIWFGLLLVLLLAFYQYVKPCCMYLIHPWCVRVARRRRRAALIRELIRFPVVVYTIERSQEHTASGAGVGVRAQCVCVICMEEYVDGDHLRVLYCSHGFHKACIDKWLVHRARCPICKATLRYAGQAFARARACYCCGRSRLCPCPCPCVEESEWSADEDEELGVDFYGVEPGLDPAYCMAASRTTIAAVAQTPTREREIGTLDLPR